MPISIRENSGKQRLCKNGHFPSENGKITSIKKVLRVSEDFRLVEKSFSTYFFFLAAFFLGAAFFFGAAFLAAFFLVAICLEFNVSKNGLTIVKITIILYYPNFFSTKLQTG